jgi:predicted NodU family carbamoyl transferase
VRAERRAQILAVTHVDGTARLQSVTASENRFITG